MRKSFQHWKIIFEKAVTFIKFTLNFYVKKHIYCFNSDTKCVQLVSTCNLYKNLSNCFTNLDALGFVLDVFCAVVATVVDVLEHFVLGHHLQVLERVAGVRLAWKINQHHVVALVNLKLQTWSSFQSGATWS